MNDNQRQAIRDSAHRLRSRLTFIMLCSHALKLDLHDVLSLKHEEEFHKNGPCSRRNKNRAKRAPETI